jgi:Rps23 Pro-64 3,4-dihydroxylase Tpa1-like proline 4-hydroxylase
MEIYTSPVTFCIVRDFYTKDEIEILAKELEKLKPHFGGPERTGTARDIVGNIKKDNRGLFIDDRNNPIVKLNRKVIKPEFIHELTKKNWFFNYIKHCNRDNTLVSYYEDSGHYKSHTDASIVTAIYYYWKEPKMFTGGDICFGDYVVPVTNNSLLIFPSCTEHEVTPLTGSGRYAITQFISKADDPPPHVPDPIRRFTNVLTIHEFNKAKSIVDQGTWTARGSSGNEKSPLKFLYMDLMNMEFFSKDLLNKIQSITGDRFHLDRVYANGQWHGLDGSWHQDNTDPRAWTFLIYLNDIPDCELDGYAGTTDFRESDFSIKSITPTSNSGLLFMSNLFHRGMSPSRFSPDMRITIAWKLRKINN